jgi:hypothetical protein
MWPIIGSIALRSAQVSPERRVTCHGAAPEMKTSDVSTP